jgi:hypothetical protein
MRYLQAALQGGKIAFLTIGGWLVAHGTTLAQGVAKANPPKSDSNSYVFSYSIVLFGVAVGLILVCRPSHRRDRARPEVYDESKALIKD